MSACSSFPNTVLHRVLCHPARHECRCGRVLHSRLLTDYRHRHSFRPLWSTCTLSARTWIQNRWRTHRSLHHIYKIVASFICLRCWDWFSSGAASISIMKSVQRFILCTRNRQLVEIGTLVETIISINSWPKLPNRIEARFKHILMDNYYYRTKGPGKQRARPS